MSISNNALSGALAAQAALNTASQNIANMQTKGYTRQGVLLAAIGPGGNVGSAGSGVEVSSLLRFSDAYKNQQMWRAASDLGLRSQTQPYLTQLERVMGDDRSSLSAGIDEFFKALNAAGVDPTSTPLRQQVVTAADSMSQHFNSIYNVTANQLLSVQQQRDAILPKLNESMRNIAALNGVIAGAGATGTNASALIDQRDQEIDKMASMVAIDVYDKADGTRSVALKGGQPLVDGSLAGTLAFEPAPPLPPPAPPSPPTLKLTFATTSFTVDDSKLGGQLGGLGDFQLNTLLPLQKSIADIAEQMTTQINTILANGIDANGQPGKPLLVFDGSSSTGLLQITSGIKANELAFASTASGMPGNTDNLQLLIGVKNQPITLTTVGTVLLGDADTQLVGKLAIDSQQNKALLNTATTIRQQAEDDWKSTSGVNEDEEAVSLIEYQRMYQANMKAVAVANSLFDATLQMFS